VNPDRLYLIHIRECIVLIEQYTTDGRDFFFGDRKTQDAVLRNLHTLSESASRLSADAPSANPEIDWRSIIAFRNVVVHDYLGIDLNEIWDIVERDLPELKHTVARMLDDSDAANDR
jgi:uncharacterized protein with HEPN domain